MNTNLTYEAQEVDGVLNIRFAGQIDEDSNFDQIKDHTCSVIKFDFESVDQINSCGIREWIEFQKNLDDNIKIIYAKCPQVIIEQMNMVKGFIKEGGKIESFFAPYFNESKDEEIKILITPDQVVDGKAPEIKSDDGEVLEFDDIELQYFSFLKNM